MIYVPNDNVYVLSVYWSSKQLPVESGVRLNIIIMMNAIEHFEKWSILPAALQVHVLTFLSPVSILIPSFLLMSRQLLIFVVLIPTFVGVV
jgi:hypothetical protein